MNPLIFLALAALMVVVVAGVIIMTLGQRRIPVQYAKRVVGRRVYGGQSTHIPLRVNTAGVIPVIFASSIIAFPATIAQFIKHPWAQTVQSWLRFGGVPYTLIYGAGIIFFTYFYTAIIFNPTDVADNMKKYGGYIPGIRPGSKTAEFIERILDRITLVGALYLAGISILPEILITQMNVPFYFGGTSLLIVVGVALDTVQQVESHLLMRHYEGFLKKAKVRGRIS
jgi:preprotein translocase subunit SecY